MYGYIYETTNLINGKKYIGQKTSSTFLAEKYLGSGVVLLRAVNKYDENNFSVKLIDTAESKAELDELEVKYISKYREQGESLYNIADGGYTTGGYLGNTTKGKIWVNDGVNHLMIEESQLAEYINKGYCRGSLNTRNYIWVTNGYSTHHIPQTQLSEYLQAGYTQGRGKSNKKWITNGIENRCINVNEEIPEGFRFGRTDTSKQPAKGKKYMYKDDEQILVNPDEVNTYLEKGYVLGKHPRSSIKGKKVYTNSVRGCRWLTNGVSNVRTKDITTYTNMGYVLGRTFNPHTK